VGKRTGSRGGNLVEKKRSSDCKNNEQRVRLRSEEQKGKVGASGIRKTTALASVEENKKRRG